MFKKLVKKQAQITQGTIAQDLWKGKCSQYLAQFTICYMGHNSPSGNIFHKLLDLFLNSDVKFNVLLCGCAVITMNLHIGCGASRNSVLSKMPQVRNFCRSNQHGPRPRAFRRLSKNLPSLSSFWQAGSKHGHDFVTGAASEVNFDQRYLLSCALARDSSADINLDYISLK